MNRTKTFKLIIAIAVLTGGLSTTADARRQRGREFVPPTHSVQMRLLLSGVTPKDENGAYTMLQEVNLHIVKLRSSIGQMKAVLLHASTEENLERLDAYEKSAEALANVHTHLTNVLANITKSVAESARAENKVASGEKAPEDHYARMREFSDGAVKANGELKKSVETLVAVQAGTKDPRIERFAKILSAGTSALGRVVDYADRTVKGLPQPIAKEE